MVKIQHFESKTLDQVATKASYSTVKAMLSQKQKDCNINNSKLKEMEMLVWAKL